MSIPKKHVKAVSVAQQQVSEVLQPYLGRCLDQLFSKTAMIETFLVCSKEVDVGDDKHAWRGTVAVHYSYPSMHEKKCVPQFYFDEHNTAKSVGLTAGVELSLLFEKVFPPQLSKQ